MSYTPASWARELLARMRLPATSSNVDAIVAWEAAEGGHWLNTARYNPLNTTQREPGSTSMNSVGVQAYTSWDQGFSATIATLRNGNYSGILAALQRGDNAAGVVAAVVASPWGTHHISLAGKSYSPSSAKSGGGGGIVGDVVGGVGSVVGGIGGAITAPFHAALSVEHFLADLVDPHTWLRVVYVIGGMALVVVGVYMLDADLTKKAGLFVGGTAGGQLVSQGFGPAAEEAAAVAAV